MAFTRSGVRSPSAPPTIKSSKIKELETAKWRTCAFKGSLAYHPRSGCLIGCASRNLAHGQRHDPGKAQCPRSTAWGGQPKVDRKARPKGVTLESWAGRVYVEWDPEAPLTPLGQRLFFIEFLKASGVFDALVA